MAASTLRFLPTRRQNFLAAASLNALLPGYRVPTSLPTIPNVGGTQASQVQTERLSGAKRHQQNESQQSLLWSLDSSCTNNKFQHLEDSCLTVQRTCSICQSPTEIVSDAPVA